MYLLDTNVVSELGRPNRVDPNVSRWARNIPSSRFFLSAISLTEIEVGVLRMERRDPRQGAVLRYWLERSILTSFSSRILPVDERVARRCARLHVPDPRPIYDALIAATALVNGLVLVTQNLGDFASTGVELVNPWVVDL